MILNNSDFVLIFYVIFINCMIGLVYILILIIFIVIIVKKYKIKNIQKVVNVRMKYENQFRIYEKNEKVVINKANKRLEEIYHSYKAIDKTIPKQNNLLLETIVEINGKKDFSDKQSIENRDILFNSEESYVRESYEIKTKIFSFDRNGNIINKFITHEKTIPIVLIEPVANELIKTETILSKIPIQIERKRIIAKREESEFDVMINNFTKTVLDVVSYGDSTVPALLVSSQTNENSEFLVQTIPNLKSDTLISNVKFDETKVLENTIEVKELPTIGSHLKIKEVPLVVNQIQIKEKRGQSHISNYVTKQVIEAEVPIVVERAITERKIPNVIPISVLKTRVLQTL